jgi:hypothetical protein
LDIREMKSGDDGEDCKMRWVELEGRGEMRSAFDMFVRKVEGTRQLGRSGCGSLL